MTQDIIYSSNYINRSRQELVDDLSRRLSKNRFQHVLRVEETALELADHYGINKEKVSIAALMHDYAKEMDQDQMLELAKEFWPDDSLSEATEGIWHGLAAAEICRSQMDCQDCSILNAIAAHTTGWYEMSPEAKVIFMADYIEPARDFNKVNKIRKIALEDLDYACYKKITTSIKHLMKNKMYIFPVQFFVYNDWNTKLKAKKKI